MAGTVNLRFPPNVVAAFGRLWTKHFGVALVVVIVAFSITLVPFGVKFFEATFTGHTAYQSFVTAIEELYLGLLAITVSSILNYLEGQDGRSLGRICASLTVFSILCTIIAIVGYFFAHFMASRIFDPAQDQGGFVVFTLIFATICIATSMANVLEARRMKDKIEEFNR